MERFYIVFIKSIYFNDWVSCREFLSILVRNSQNIKFRGQKGATWRLKSSLSRLLRNLNKNYLTSTANTLEIIEKELIDKFLMASNYLPTSPVPTGIVNNYNELTAFAQHYGVPTRLLDWTRSPYIAAFFAFDGCSMSAILPQKNVAIWAFDIQAYKKFEYNRYNNIPLKNPTKESNYEETITKIFSDQENLIDWININGNKNRRLVFQEGLFTRVNSRIDDIELVLEQSKVFSVSPILFKIKLPSSMRIEVLNDLRLMTITPVTLMNDFEGAATTAFNDQFISPL